MVVYLSIHIANSFYTLRHTTLHQNHSFFKQGTEGFIHLQRAEKTTISENVLTLHQLIQKAAWFFILLLFGIGALESEYEISLIPDKFIPHRHTYLRYCVLRL